MEILVGKNPTLPGSIHLENRVSFKDFLHVKKREKKRCLLESKTVASCIRKYFSQMNAVLGVIVREHRPTV